MNSLITINNIINKTITIKTTSMIQEELIKQAIKKAETNFLIDMGLLPCNFEKQFADTAIRIYIEMSEGSIVDINDDGEVESIQEYSQSKHDCENILDNVDKWALTQKVDVPLKNDEGYEEFMRIQRFHEEIAGIGHDIVLKYLESKENERHSRNNILKVTKREPHRINHLVQIHNMKYIDNMNLDANAVTIVECDIIWNDEQWNDDHIIPYVVAISERDLDHDIYENVGFRFTSPADMKKYLKYDSKNDFTIVRINNHYQL